MNIFMQILQNQVAVITGSSRGIGAAIAKAFAQEGACVVLHGRDHTALQAVQADIERFGGRATSIVGDVTNFDAVEALRRYAEGHYGPIDVLVANAGGNVTPPGPLESIAEDAWRAAIDGNLTATFLSIKSVLPGMKARRNGIIITISSAAARRPHPGSPIPYAAAKAGIQILTQDVAAQAGPYNIRVNCIAPETILTERNRTDIPDQRQSQLADAHPLKRLGTPDDVAQAAVFLASPASAWITGVILDVAGGAVMTV
jgi:3-oxoacyl-[acyl-carrier protein] reductase